MDKVIFEKVGGIEVNINWLVADAKKKNGYIADLFKKAEDRKDETTSLRTDYNSLFKAMSLAIGEWNKYMDGQKEKENRKRNFWIYIKENYVVFILVSLSSGITGTFVPLIWEAVKSKLGS